MTERADKWEFHQEGNGDWRWTRKAPNGEVVGMCHEGYRNKGDCEGNARRNGWPGSVDYIIDEMLASKVFED